MIASQTCDLLTTYVLLFATSKEQLQNFLAQGPSVFCSRSVFCFLCFTSARFVGGQCLFVLRIFNADMDWVEGANFLDTSDFLP